MFKIYMAKKLQLSVSMVKFTSVVRRVGKLECMLKFGSAFLVQVCLLRVLFSFNILSNAFRKGTNVYFSNLKHVLAHVLMCSCAYVLTTYQYNYRGLRGSVARDEIITGLLFVEFMCNTRYSALMLEYFLMIEGPFYQVLMDLCLRDEDITQV